MCVCIYIYIVYIYEYIYITHKIHTYAYVIRSAYLRSGPRSAYPAVLFTSISLSLSLLSLFLSRSLALPLPLLQYTYKKTWTPRLRSVCPYIDII
jgi:hypothetical protein